VLEELSCNARWSGLVFDRAGDAIWRSRSRRSVTDTQWQALLATYGGCFHCAAPAGMCQAHHITPYSKGGATSLDNLIMVCWNCHHKIHHHNWQITKHSDGSHSLHPPRQRPGHSHKTPLRARLRRRLSTRTKAADTPKAKTIPGPTRNQDKPNKNRSQSRQKPARSQEDITRTDNTTNNAPNQTRTAATQDRAAARSRDQTKASDPAHGRQLFGAGHVDAVAGPEPELATLPCGDGWQLVRLGRVEHSKPKPATPPCGDRPGFSEHAATRSTPTMQPPGTAVAVGGFSEHAATTDPPRHHNGITRQQPHDNRHLAVGSREFAARVTGARCGAWHGWVRRL
ncbi:MAG: HNH endonuclease signature motif containing protein, partial [Acidimicrobiaceae bacterium]|nr:HNH endonuclease signature motif containing protein [Acidimicrobiaceae bacterium]